MGALIKDLKVLSSKTTEDNYTIQHYGSHIKNRHKTSG